MSTLVSKMEQAALAIGKEFITEGGLKAILHLVPQPYHTVILALLVGLGKSLCDKAPAAKPQAVDVLQSEPKDLPWEIVPFDWNSLEMHLPTNGGS